MDVKALKAEIVKKGFTHARLSKEIGISKAAFSKKINGKSEFTLGEIQRIVDVLEIESPIPIFFASKVS